MANNYTSLKLSYDTAYRFVEDFSSTDHSSIKYVFIGNSIPTANSDTDVNSIEDTVKDEKSVWDKMYAAKRVTGNDVQLVIPKVTWTSDTKYRQYDDTTDIEKLVTANTSLNLKPIYVMTSEYNVYKCLCNNVSANSTVEPSGDYTSSNGFISTADGYLWKYMYNVKPSNKFLTNDWIPAPTSVDEIEFDTDQANIIDGALAKIVVTNRGTGYIDSNVNVAVFSAGVTTLTGIDDMTNVANNMFVTGTGILSGTYITSRDTVLKTITLSSSTANNGGGSANPITLKTRVFVDGDGNNDILTSVTISNTEIQKITVTSIGTNYSRANIAIYGTGSGANARAVLPPKYGHGYNPAKELGSRSVMVSQKIGEVDSTENGLISVDTSFRQYGLLSAPHKYGQSEKVSLANANNVISQTYDVTVVAGPNYTLGEFVYQGASITSPTFSGTLHAQETNVIRLIDVKGQFSSGSYLKGDSSGTSRAAVSLDTPEFEPYTGDVLYVQNALKVDRAEGQAEDVKFVIKF